VSNQTRRARGGPRERTVSTVRTTGASSADGGSLAISVADDGTSASGGVAGWNGDATCV